MKQLDKPYVSNYVVESKDWDNIIKYYRELSMACEGLLQPVIR